MCLGVLPVPFGVPRADLFAECGLCRDTTPKALTTQMAAFNLSHVEPTAVLGSIMDRSFICDPFRLRRIKSFIKRRFGMGIEIVHHQTNCSHMRIMLINKFSEKIRPINLCPRCCDFRISLTHSWCKSDKNVCCSISLILCIIPWRDKSGHCGRYAPSSCPPRDYASLRRCCPGSDVRAKRIS
jgi:hypothetical protein